MPPFASSTRHSLCLSSQSPTWTSLARAASTKNASWQLSTITCCASTRFAGPGGCFCLEAPSRCLGSSHDPHFVCCRVARPRQPDIGRRFPRPQARYGRIVVLVHFVVAGSDVDGDEFAVILRPKRRPHLPVENFSAKVAEFIEGTAWGGGRHGVSFSWLDGRIYCIVVAGTPLINS